MALIILYTCSRKQYVYWDAVIPPPDSRWSSVFLLPLNLLVLLVARNHKRNFWSKENVLGAAEQLPKIAIADHLATISIPEVVRQTLVNGAQVISPLGNIMAASTPQHLFVARHAVGGHGLGSEQEAQKH